MSKFWVVLFILLVLIAAGFSYFLLQFDPNTLRPQLETHFGHLMKADVKLASVSIRWSFMPEMILEGLLVSEPGSGDMLLQAEKVLLRADLLGLLKKELHAASFRLESPHFVFVRRPDKSWNWNASFFEAPEESAESKGPPSAASWKFHLGQLEASDAVLDYTDTSLLPPFHWTASKANILIFPSDNHGAALQIQFETPLGRLPVKGTVRLDREPQALSFKANLGDSALHFEAQISQFFSAPRFRFQAKSKELSLEDLAPLTPGLPVLGRLSAALEGTGEGLHPSDWRRSLAFSGEFRLQDGEVLGFNASHKVLRDLADIPVPGLRELMKLDYPFDFTAVFEGQNTPFQTWTGRVQWSEEKLFVDQMILSYPDYQIQLGGAFHGRDQYASFRGAIAFSKPLSGVILEGVPEMDVLTNLQDEVLIPMEFRGTFPNAEVFVDHDFIANRFIQTRGEILASLGIQKLNEYLEAHRQ